FWLPIAECSQTCFRTSGKSVSNPGYLAQRQDKQALYSIGNHQSNPSTALRSFQRATQKRNESKRYQIRHASPKLDKATSTHQLAH
ncbi:MAG TPA: hypothetical protein DCR61_02045, partial [Verrucomicrobiales bacterium]|nr:hypothetical protein [Verrucomicrobiales bacterium]